MQKCVDSRQCEAPRACTHGGGSQGTHRLSSASAETSTIARSANWPLMCSSTVREHTFRAESKWSAENDRSTNPQRSRSTVDFMLAKSSAREKFSSERHSTNSGRSHSDRPSPCKKRQLRIDTRKRATTASCLRKGQWKSIVTAPACTRKRSELGLSVFKSDIRTRPHCRPRLSCPHTDHRVARPTAHRGGTRHDQGGAGSTVHTHGRDQQGRHRHALGPRGVLRPW